MNDHQLTFYAAKATGREFYYEGGVFILADAVGQECSAWHPLHDDGDALRLAVRLGILMRTDFVKLLSELMNSGTEHQEAARRSIVIIAAKIGRLKP